MVLISLNNHVIRTVSMSDPALVVKELYPSVQSQQNRTDGLSLSYTVKPVCNDHLYDKIYYVCFIQQCVLMKTEGNKLLLLTISAFWSSSRWPLAT